MNHLKPTFSAYAQYKDSGVEWLGEIPLGWEVKRLKHLLKINNGNDHKHVISDSGYPVYGSGGQFAFATQYLFDGDAILLGRKGTIDKPLLILGKFWTVDTMFYANLNSKNDIRYIFYSSKQIPFPYYSTSTALPSMTQSDLNNHQTAPHGHE
ncbi:MAG: restriction endonuclease subunit S [Candidatus Endonucleobacter bathymodioli]|uniref:Restriction endonuclease subunit S n=1 Tax=Candidatus Endonucleibacter bathymodioli TaxID=539814 RepID=A0AA90NSD1_9GAMM|nr:restriction endonuclease subunit S [Candidatus Endonucleobacter bathymodioli]